MRAYKVFTVIFVIAACAPALADGWCIDSNPDIPSVSRTYTNPADTPETGNPAIKDIYAACKEHEELCDVYIGYKNAGAIQGMQGGDWLLTEEERLQYRDQALAVDGVKLVMDPPSGEGCLGADLCENLAALPASIVSIASEVSIDGLLSLPFIDYVVPRFNILHREGAPWLQVSPVVRPNQPGCGWGDYEGPDGEIDPFTGDIVPWNYEVHRIQEAWGDNWDGPAGRDITVAVLDTGISLRQASLWMTPKGTFDSFIPRLITTTGTGGESPQEDSPDCSHGTRITSIVAAPRDGANVEGVAWAANVDSYHSLHKTFLVSVLGITIAVTDTARVVNAIYAASKANPGNGLIFQMAWGSPDPIGPIHDAIEDVYTRPNRPVFIAAAGTTYVERLIYPAAYPEAVSVTGFADEGGLVDNCAWGHGIDFATVMSTVRAVGGDTVMPAAGKYTGETVHLGGSSAASAVASGIAALVWSEDPARSADELERELACRAIKRPKDDVGRVASESWATYRGVLQAAQ